MPRRDGGAGLHLAVGDGPDTRSASPCRTSPWNTSGVRALHAATSWNNRRRISSRTVSRSSAFSGPRPSPRLPLVASSTNVHGSHDNDSASHH
ncbi:hypothetical protein [Streptomyces sp. NPDC057623]|uniref:hypothetical protein n=1 Tax=Streptomyces sp. NPDC057623 TaxID=3346187 RepID=UPI003696E345